MTSRRYPWPRRISTHLGLELARRQREELVHGRLDHPVAAADREDREECGHGQRRQRSLGDATGRWFARAKGDDRRDALDREDDQRQPAQHHPAPAHHQRADPDLAPSRQAEGESAEHQHRRRRDGDPQPRQAHRLGHQRDRAEHGEPGDPDPGQASHVDAEVPPGQMQGAAAADALAGVDGVLGRVVGFAVGRFFVGPDVVRGGRSPQCRETRVVPGPTRRVGQPVAGDIEPDRAVARLGPRAVGVVPQLQGAVGGLDRLDGGALADLELGVQVEGGDLVGHAASVPGTCRAPRASGGPG